jgi:hypothetical protein
MVLPGGWRQTDEYEWTHTDGSKAMADPSKPDGIIALANAIPGMGALTSLNLAKNDLGRMVPPEGWRAEYGDGQSPWIHTDGTRVEEGMPEGSKPEAIIAVANAIKDMRALTSLNVSNNYIGQLVYSSGGKGGKGRGKGRGKGKGKGKGKGGRVFGKGKGRGEHGKPNTKGAIAIANAIKDMGALIKLDISRNGIGAEQEGGLQRICVAGGIELAK